MQLKYRKRKRPGTNEDAFFYPSNCPQHERLGFPPHNQTLRTSRQLDLPITVIPSNTEKFVAFQIGKLRSSDSLQFLNASLDKLVGIFSADAFKYTSKFSPSPQLALRKGVYPYEYATDPSEFEETCLPPKEKFYSALNESEITDDDYNRAQEAWNVFNCATLRDYHDAYLKTDVLLLADVFENFREMCLKNYGLEPAHFYTTPGMSFQACLKMSGVKLELFTDTTPICTFSSKTTLGAACPLSPIDTPRLTTVIRKTDWTRRNPHPTYAILTPTTFTVTQCLNPYHFKFPFHDVSTRFPRTPKSFPGQHVLTEKFIPNLNDDKTKYVTHYVNLKLYIHLGMKLKLVYRVLQFDQSPWMKPYTDFNTDKRRQATTDFERDFYKLLNNSVFGKTMENLRNRVNVTLCNDEIKAKKIIASPTF